MVMYCKSGTMKLDICKMWGNLVIRAVASPATVKAE